MKTVTSKKVFVGMSGGVDSSVAAYLLQKEGYDVVGVFIKVWHPDFLPCEWETERRDAMRVAAHLGIPFLTCDAELAYKEYVADYFIAEYKKGRTPNPDVMCNKFVKFGAFYDFAISHGADYIATGHYAQRLESDHGFNLVRGLDENKDQTYFLWTLTQEQLSKTLLPVGGFNKTKIRALAKIANIPTATKKDSQGICFLGKVDIYEFLKEFIEITSGDVIDSNNRVIGRHKGALIYTLGQGHGFDVTHHEWAGKKAFVTAIDLSTNTITVSSEPETKTSKYTQISQVHFINPDASRNLESGKKIAIQTRYRQTPVTATVQLLNKDTKQAMLISDHKDVLWTPGQSCVFYQDTICLGGGIID